MAIERWRGNMEGEGRTGYGGEAHCSSLARRKNERVVLSGLHRRRDHFKVSAYAVRYRLF